MADSPRLQVTPPQSVADWRVAALTGAGLLVGLVLGWIAWRTMAAGHGTYLPAIAFFPVPMALAVFGGVITTPWICVALAQFPIYGFLLGLRSNPQARRAFASRLCWIHLILAAVATSAAAFAGRFFP